jgi:hypothetical protein
MLKKERRSRGRPRRGAAANPCRPLGGASEAAEITYLRGNEPVGYSHFLARQAFYSALVDYGGVPFAQLAEAAARPSLDGFDEFNGFLDTWLRRYQFWPDPKSNLEWLEWFTNDALDSYADWTLNHPTEPFRITAHCPERCWDDDSDEWIEVRSMVRFQSVACRKDEAGTTQVEVINESEAMAILVDRFKEAVGPKLSQFFKRAEELGAVAPTAPSLHDDMRRYVLKHFRRLDSLDIAVAEAKGDPGAQLEATDAERTAVSLNERRRIDISIDRAAKRLSAPARPHKRGRKPVRALSQRRD